MGQLDKKIAVVTGADSGIGRGIALQLAQEGATVVINYAHARDKAEVVLQEIEQKGGQGTIIQANVGDYQQAMRLIGQAVEKYGRIDILCNNAGMEIHSPFVDVTEQDFDRVLSIDLTRRPCYASKRALLLCKGGHEDADAHHCT